METITERDFQPQTAAPRTMIVKFTNPTNEAFTWTWNKVPYTFLPGEENAKFMEAGLAKHFAKHLVNRELLKRGRENDTSPKNPEQNPFFMELYNRIVSPVTSEGEMDATKAEQETIDRNMKAKMARQTAKKSPTVNEDPEEVPDDEKNDESGSSDEDFEVLEVAEDEEEPVAEPEAPEPTPAPEPAAKKAPKKKK